MQLSVTGKQIDVGDALRQHVETALSGIIGKYFGTALEGHVVFSREAHLIRADLSVHVFRELKVQGQAAAADAYSAFDSAAERIAKRIRRYKRRLRDHHGRPRAGEEALPLEETWRARSYVLAEPAEEPEDAGVAAADDAEQPVIIAEMSCDIPLVTVREAVMRMDLGDMSSFIFRNSAHGGLNVVYRRRDGNIGWVDPHFGRPAPKETSPSGTRKS